MVQRVKTAAVALAMLLVWLMFSHTIVMNIGICVIATVCLYELFNAAGYIKNTPSIGIAGLIYAATIPFKPFFSDILSQIFFVVFIFYAFIILLKNRETISINTICTIVLFSFLIPTALSCITAIRRMDEGAYLIALVFAITWTTDSFAYIFGSSYGTKKLCPSISPNKTVEGAVMGTFGGLAAVLVFDVIMRYFYMYSLTNILPLLVAAILCSLAAQIGDLSASAVKRELKIKDFGNIFPGHGGMLDRFDSILFVSPVLYLFLQMFRVLI